MVCFAVLRHDFFFPLASTNVTMNFLLINVTNILGGDILQKRL